MSHHDADLKSLRDYVLVAEINSRISNDRPFSNWGFTLIPAPTFQTWDCKLGSCNRRSDEVTLP